MIPARLHGAIDAAMVALLAGFSAGLRVRGPVRGILGAASAAQLACVTLTDYEAGMWPRLGMRRHLALDEAGGVGLIATGLLLRRTSPAGRMLLLGLGLVELGVALFSDTVPRSGPGLADLPAGYEPLDTLKPVAADLFIVDSTLPGAAGAVLAARMTVIRLAGGDLLLHSPTRFTASLRREIEAHGRIRHLVAPSFAHWMFLEAWQHAIPEARSWAAPGLRERRPVRASGVRLDAELGETAPAEWGGDIETVPVRGGFGFTEIGLFHRPTRTLLLSDLVLNLEVVRLPRWMRPLAHYLGVLAPDGMPPPYVRAVIKARRAEAQAGARRLLALRPERVVFAHGRWFERDGAAALRRSLRWLVR